MSGPSLGAQESCRLYASTEKVSCRIQIVKQYQIRIVSRAVTLQNGLSEIWHSFILIKVADVDLTERTLGFPDSMAFSDFRRQFEVLRITPFEGGETEDSVFDEREVRAFHSNCFCHSNVHYESFIMIQAISRFYLYDSY